MAIVDVKSTQYGNRDANPPVPNNPEDVGGKLRLYRFDFNQGSVAGDAASRQSLCRIAPGRGYIVPILSRSKWSAFGASRLLDIGVGTYTKPDGTVVAATADTIDDGRDVNAAGVAFLGAGTNGVTDAISYNAQNEIVISSTVAGGTIPASATLNGWIAAIESK